MKSQGKLDYTGLATDNGPAQRDGTSPNAPRIVRVYGWPAPTLRASIRGTQAFMPEVGSG